MIVGCICLLLKVNSVLHESMQIYIDGHNYTVNDKTFEGEKF